jgi:hypothetical protein
MNYQGTLTVDSSIVIGTSAIVGGAIYNYFATTTISNSILCHNSASSTTNAGGGLYILGGTVTVEDSSRITGNSAPSGLGTDVLNHGTLYVDGTSTIGILFGTPAFQI